MAKKFKVWLDSGANAYSCYKQEVSLDELGISDKEWESMTDDERDNVMRDVSWDRMDWGYSEIEE